MAWFGPLLYVPSAVLTNPTDGTVIAASGALSRGQWLFGVAGSASVAIVFDLLLVTAALATRRRPVAGDIDVLFPNQVTVVQDEVARLVLVGNVTGTVQLSLFGILVG